MTAETLVREYLERVWNQADLEAFESLTTPTFTYRIGSQPPRDRASMAAFVSGVHRAFPDWRVHVEQVMVDGRSVAVRWSGRVTHDGEFLGLAPTGRTASVSGVNIYEVDHDRVGSEWEHMDTIGLLAQLGASLAG